MTIEAVKKLIPLLQGANRILLSTHKQCDGDGLGAELAMGFALKKMGKEVYIVNVDQTPRKYRFLQPEKHIQIYLNDPHIPEDIDLALIFDTNDRRIVEPLFSAVEKNTKNIAFVDHHPVLSSGPQPSRLSWIETNAASTGEMAYDLIHGLGIAIDAKIAEALYTSVTFDTQLYRYIRNSPKSHLIAAELLSHGVDVPKVHRHLFAHQTPNKIAFLASALARIEYSFNLRVAFVRVLSQDLVQFKLDPDDVRDIIDMLMNIENLEAAVIVREDGPGTFKLSLRSKGKIPVLPVAEALGGGGHLYSSGAYVKMDVDPLKEHLMNHFSRALKLLDEKN